MITCLRRATPSTCAGTHAAAELRRLSCGALVGMDLEHAHAIEYSLPAEIGQVQSYKSRSNQASTFRGTLKLESLVGTKFDVPDVSKMAPIGS